MNVASLGLCKELYELSGKTWHEELIYSWHKDDGNYVIEDFWTGSICPAYDLGYLLRKLPAQTLLLKYSEVYKATMPFNGDATADTPEDAAAKLAIELFKQKVLTK